MVGEEFVLLEGMSPILLLRRVGRLDGWCADFFVLWVVLSELCVSSVALRSEEECGSAIFVGDLSPSLQIHSSC